jgi:hypothetical protein
MSRRAVRASWSLRAPFLTFTPSSTLLPKLEALRDAQAQAVQFEHRAAARERVARRASARAAAAAADAARAESAALSQESAAERAAADATLVSALAPHMGVDAEALKRAVAIAVRLAADIVGAAAAADAHGRALAADATGADSHRSALVRLLAPALDGSILFCLNFMGLRGAVMQDDAVLCVLRENATVLIIAFILAVCRRTALNYMSRSRQYKALLSCISPYSSGSVSDSPLLYKPAPRVPPHPHPPPPPPRRERAARRPRRGRRRPPPSAPRPTLQPHATMPRRSRLPTPLRRRAHARRRWRAS